MKFNKRLGIYLAAPFALMAMSVTTANADTVSSDNSTVAQSQVAMVQQNSDQQIIEDADNSSTTAVSSINSSSSAASDSASSTSTETAVANVGTNKIAMPAGETDNKAISPTTSSTSGDTQTFSPVSTQPVSYSQLFTSLYTTSYNQQQINNATYIYNYFISKGWTAQAISGMLGNMVSESGLNPAINQYGGGGGYGLAQWPAATVKNWCNSNGYNPATLEGQCALVQYQMTHHQQWYATSAYRLTADQYMHSTASPYYLGMAFLHNFERPKNLNQPARGQQAQYWYEYFQSHGSTTAPVVQKPTQSTTITSGSMMNQRGTFKVAYGLNIRQAPSTSAAIVAKYSGGQSFTYDSKVEVNGYLWVSYMSYSGARRYVAIKNLNTGQTYGTDSNSFSYTGTASTPSTTPTPTPTQNNNSGEQTMQQRGTFRVAYGLNIRKAPSTSAKVMAQYDGGQSFTYDSKVEANGYLWVSYMSYSGARRYAAIKNLSTGQTFGTDSNNFSFNGNSSASSTTGGSTTTPTTNQSSKAQQIISLARQQIGKPYVWGATGPNSFDCSGLVQYVYQQAGINLPRTSAQQSTQGYSVSLNSLQPGDLVFWRNSAGNVYHVAIYTGNGNVLFAPQPGQTVKEQPMRYWMPSFGRRVL